MVHAPVLVEEQAESIGLEPEEFVEALLALPDEAAQRQFLAEHLPTLDDSAQDEVANLLKSESDRFLRSDIDRCLRTGELILFIARLLDNAWHRALGLRAKANAYGHGGLGDYQQAIELYDEAGEIYRTYGHVVYQAVTQHAKVGPLARLGRYEEAFAIGKWAARVFEENQEWLWLAKLSANMGVLYRRLGQDVRSLALYDRARDLYKQLDNNPEAHLALARMEQNRTVALRNLGRFEEAVEASKRAWEMLNQSGQSAEAARARQNLAITYFVLGRYNETLALLDESRDVFLTDGRQRDAVLVELFTCDCLLQLRRFAEVLDKCAQARNLFAQLGTRFEMAQSILNEAIAYAGLNRYQEALATLHEVRHLFAEEGYDAWVASTDLETAAVLLLQGQFERSLSTALACARVFGSHDFPVEKAQALLVAARAAVELAHYEQAESLVTTALAIVKKQDIPALKYQAHYLLGSMKAAQYDLESARHEYHQATDELERLRGRLMVEHRADFLEDKEVVYEELVRLSLEVGQPEEALMYAERAKSRVLLDLLAFRLNLGLEARDSADQPLVDELVRLRDERDRLYRRWQGGELTNERGTTILDGSQQLAQENVVMLEKRITEQWHKLLIRNADYARDAALWQVRTESPQPYLDDETILVEYFISHGQPVAFWVTSEKIRARRLPVKLAQLQHLLQLFWLNLRAVPKSSPDRLTHLTANARGILGRLSEHLVMPLASEVADYRKLIIVPHGPLHYLPFHALWDGESPLLSRHQVSYLPSASFLRYCCEAPSVESGLLVVGHSYEAHLPYAIQEAQTIAALGNGCLFLESEATLAQVREVACDYRMLHLAAHGDFRPDNPLFSGLALADGWLTTLDIFNLRLQASLVTLSACQTGRSVIGGGDELLGLMRAFLSAGAASLVLSLWAVEDRSTSILMETFYRRLADGWTKGEALRQAQLELCQNSGNEKVQYQHPYFWAPFYLVGDAGPL